MNGIQIEMPQYQSHKNVWALKIKELIAHIDRTTGSNKVEEYIIVPVNIRYGEITVSPEWMKKHEPQVGGYYVVYEDGYESYSPAEAFESGYTLITK